MRVLREGPRHQVNYEQESDQDFMQMLNDFLDVHFSDPMLTVEEVATATDMSTEQLTAQLKQLARQTPKEYISDFRLKKAVDLLTNTDDTIAQIAISCGYTDPNTFNRIFKNKTGMMPSKYRDMNKKNLKQDEHTDEYELMEWTKEQGAWS